MSSLSHPNVPLLLPMPPPPPPTLLHMPLGRWGGGGLLLQCEQEQSLQSSSCCCWAAGGGQCFSEEATWPLGFPWWRWLKVGMRRICISGSYYTVSHPIVRPDFVINLHFSVVRDSSGSTLYKLSSYKYGMTHQSVPKVKLTEQTLSSSIQRLA